MHTTVLSGTLKFFNIRTGWGMVATPCGDAIIGGRQLDAWPGAIPQGATVKVLVEMHKHGLRVRRIIDAAVAPKLQPAAGQWIKGEVKFFDRERGFGFIAIGGRDAFVHATVASACGLARLESGEPVEVVTGDHGKGLRVAAIRKA